MGKINFGADYRNRTDLTSLEGWRTTNMPSPQNSRTNKNKKAKSHGSTIYITVTLITKKENKMKCSQCQQETGRIPKKSGQKNVFCNASCSAKFNNKLSKKRQLTKRYCKRCGENIHRKNHLDQRKLCGDCNPNIKDWSTITLGEARKIRKSFKNSRLRQLARDKYIKSDMPKECCICGYSKHYEVAHIMPIYEHSEDTPISQINSSNNLIGLCRNCHWEFDNGHIPISTIQSLVFKLTENKQ